MPADERARLLAAPRFGEVFTDHMARMTWTADGGWGARRVEPYAPLRLEPASLVLHYGQEIFEGLKAYRHPDGSIWTFRPEANAARFAASARRMALPELAAEDFLASIRALVEIDRDWVPDGADASLYLRPVMLASEAQLLVRAAREVEYVVIASPAGEYFAGGVNPVSIWVAQDLHRAGPGGTGAVKTMGNYGASLASQAQAYAHGCEQVCFLDARTGSNLEELGGMNVVAVLDDGCVVTPALDGTILPGITRDAVLTLLAQEGRDVAERALPLAEVLDGLRLREGRRGVRLRHGRRGHPDRPAGRRGLRRDRRRRGHGSGDRGGAHPPDRRPARQGAGRARLDAPPGAGTRGTHE